MTGEPGGRLVAFQTTGMFNTAFQEGQLTDEEGNVLTRRVREPFMRYPEDKTFAAPAELELLHTYTVDAVLRQDNLDSNRTFGLWWFWTNRDGTAVRLLGVDDVRAYPRDPKDENDTGFENEGKVSVSYTPQPGENGEGWIIGIVNPGEVFWLGNSETEELFNLLHQETVRRGTPQAMFEYPPVWELAADLNASLYYLMGMVHDGCFTTYPETELKEGDPYLAAVDNFVRLPIRVSGSDLAIVDATAPPSVLWSEGGWYNVSFTVQNGTGIDVATDWTATLDGDVIAAGTRTWYAGTEGNTVTFTVPIDRGGRSYAVKIEVNPDRVVLEDSYDNNTRTVVTVVGPEPAPPPPDTWDRDPTEEMLVPIDCSENSDPTAPEPCTDYPNLTAPWYCAYNPNAPECRGYTDDGEWYDIPPDDDR